MVHIRNKIDSMLLLWVAEAILIIWAITGLFGKDAVYDYSVTDMSAFQGVLLEENSGIYVEASQGVSGEVVRYQLKPLKAGVYRVALHYETDTDLMNFCEVVDGSTDHKNLLTNGTNLYSGLNCTGFDMWLKMDADDLDLIVRFGGEGSLTVRNLTIYETNAMARIRLFIAVVASIMINTVCWLIRSHKKHPFSQKKINVVFGLGVIIIVGAYPLMTDVILYGGDTVFHLLRVEGIKDALLDGQFPARIAPQWQHGHGYAASIFYGETLLYVQAFFRMIGFTILTSYRMYQFLLLTATVLVSYYCFKKMFGEPYIGLLCSALYSLSVYRIYKTFQVGAYGESSAILFLPLIAYGFYRVFADDITLKEYKRSWIPLTIGFTGLVQSHMLSGELTGAFTILLCLILWKRVFRKQTFIVLAKTVVYTCIVSAWFIVPFADYMLTGDFQIQHVSGRTIQERGLYPAHLFKVFVESGNEVLFAENGMLQSDPQTVGVALLFGLGLWCFLCLHRQQRLLKKEEWNTGRIAALFSVLAMVFSLAAFPWNKLQFMNSLTVTLISSLQFPHRFLTIGTISLTVLCGVVGKCLMEQPKEAPEKKYSFAIYSGVMVFLLTISSVHLMNDMMDTKEFIRIYNSEGMSYGYVSSGEYLPYGTDINQLMYKEYICEENLQVYSYDKKGLSAKIDCFNSSEKEAFLQLPILYYKGYAARDAETGETLSVYDGNNHMVSVAVPAGYEGEIQVSFVSPWYWRVAELLSLGAFVVFIIYVKHMKRTRTDTSL